MAKMPGNVQELRPRAGEAEKITINLGYVDLGHIDLLVQEGFYSNRTDFIRTAIRNHIERHAETTQADRRSKKRRTGPAPLQPGRSGSRAGCWADFRHPGARAGHHR